MSFGIYTFRVSLLLRGAFLYFPETSIGVAIANYLANMATGKLVFGLFAIIPVLNIVFGYLAYAIARKSELLAALTLGVLFSLVVAYNNALLAHIPFVVALVPQLVSQVPLTIAGWLLFRQIVRRA